MERKLLPFSQKQLGELKIFQQDGVKSHISKTKAGWYKNHNVYMSLLPVCFPDINIIENVEGWLASEVYIEGFQFRTFKELKEAIDFEYRKSTSNTSISCAIL